MSKKQRVRIGPLTVHPATEKYIKTLTSERAIPVGQAVDILYMDLLAAQRQIKQLEKRLEAGPFHPA
jgi:hypothetical protein